MADFLTSAAILATARDIISPSLVYSNYVSPPVVTLSDSEPLLSFLIGRGEVANAESGYLVWPPNLVAYFDVVGGRMVELRAVSPPYFDRHDDPEDPLSKGYSPLEKTGKDYLEKQIGLLQACDVLTGALLDEKNHQAAFETYDAAMMKTLEPALMPYYRRLVLNRLPPVAY